MFFLKKISWLILIPPIFSIKIFINNSYVSIKIQQQTLHSKPISLSLYITIFFSFFYFSFPILFPNLYNRVFLRIYSWFCGKLRFHLKTFSSFIKTIFMPHFFVSWKCCFIKKSKSILKMKYDHVIILICLYFIHTMWQLWQNNKVEGEENKKEKLECREKKQNEFSLEVSPFYRESQRDIHQYGWSSTSSHNPINSHIL